MTYSESCQLLTTNFSFAFFVILHFVIANRIWLIAVIIIMMSLAGVASLHAQFSGSITLGGYHTTNADASVTAAGKDTSTPDNVINPILDLIYNWNISDPSEIKFELSFSPNVFTTVPARSFDKTTIGATGSFYLSDVSEKPKPVAVTPPRDTGKSQPEKKPESQKQAISSDTVKPVIIIKPAQRDISQIVAGKLAELSGLLDSFDYDDKGLSEDSSDAASDLKDSVSESVLALSEILTSEVFTESIASVVLSETQDQEKIFSQVPMEPVHKKEITDAFDTIIVLLNKAKPQGDLLPVPKSKVEAEPAGPMPATVLSEKNDLIAQALAHLQSEDKEAVKSENAPILTLINTQTEFKDMSSQDILLKEDINPLTKKTLATELTIPATYEVQNNRSTYISYGYSQFEIAPRIDLYAGSNFAFAVTYDLTTIQFPYDSVHVNDGTEHKLRFDMRLQPVLPFFVIIADGGVSSKNYTYPLKYYVPVTGKQDKLVTTAADYSHFFLGGGLMFFPASRFTVSIAGAITRSSSLRPYLVDSTRAALLGKTRVAGTQNDDQYSYELSRLSIFSLWRIFYDIDFSFDYAYENRAYSDQQLARVATKINPHPKPVAIKRTDTGPLIGFDLKKEILFDSRLASIFDSFTPSVDVQSTNYKSTVKLFSYKDVTTTISLEFGF